MSEIYCESNITTTPIMVDGFWEFAVEDEDCPMLVRVHPRAVFNLPEPKKGLRVFLHGTRGENIELKGVETILLHISRDQCCVLVEDWDIVQIHSAAEQFNAYMQAHCQRNIHRLELELQRLEKEDDNN